jgi:hypothetical protein
MSDTLYLHLEWRGPFTFQEAQSFTNAQSDYGVYQVHGSHPVYGDNVLLYIGKADKQTFGIRLGQEGWEGWQQNNGAVTVRLGRLHGSETPSFSEWSIWIDRAEALLIRAHRPAHNASRLFKTPQDAQNIHLLNWGERGVLLPEVSGARWTSRFANMPDYVTFGTHKP